MRLLIITGLSGAGKSNAVNILEDAGYYCVDNMPPSFIAKFAELCGNPSGKLDRVALVCDIRGGEMFGELATSLQELRDKKYPHDILFFDADDETLINRYKETRRKHPLSVDERLSDAIAKERARLSNIKSKANYIIDTSAMSLAQLRAELVKMFPESGQDEGMLINILSFGFKYGVPMDADLIFDVRFIPNPFYIPELKEKSGLDAPVADYVMGFSQSLEFRDKLFDMIDFLLPHFLEGGRRQVVIGIGCTGGRHRSVAFAQLLAAHLKENGYRAYSGHRDYNKKRNGAEPS
ncbi:nucleotide-binding protein [Clostridia bacterium]|nr:nucleotide-binding protein [Clostridia bacterium]